MSENEGVSDDPLAALKAIAAGAPVDGKALAPRARGLLRQFLNAPQVAAMYSITDLARMTDVNASTLTRLAQRLGHPGFGGLQDIFRKAVMLRGDSYSRRAGMLLSSARREAGVDEVVHQERANLEELARRLDRNDVSDAANALIAARRVFVLGLRQSFSLAHGMHYVLSMMRDDVRLLGEGGHRLAEEVAHVGPGDVLVAISVHPYTRETVLAARHARRQGARLITISDPDGEGVLEGGAPAFVVPALGAFPFNVMAAAIVLVEAVMAATARKLGDRALAVLGRQEALFDSFRTEVVEHDDAIKAGPRKNRRQHRGGKP